MTTGLWLVMGAAVVTRIGAGPMLRPVLRYESGGVDPVIGTPDENAFLPGYGFEGGQVVKVANVYHMFSAEFKGWPVNSNMRIAIWSANHSSGPWRRVTVIAESPDQPAGSNWSCSSTGIDASPWAPFPVFDADEDRWHVLWVGYACDLSWVVRAGLGNIFGAVSSVPGVAGVAGPYLPYGVVIGPNATVNGTTWGDLSKCSVCLAEDPRPPFCEYPPCRYANGHTGAAIGIGPYKLLRPSAGIKYAAFVGLDHNLAWAPSPRGPWTVGTSAQVGQDMNSKIGTTSSLYSENPVISQITDPEGVAVLVAVFDTVSPTGGWEQQPPATPGAGWSWGPSHRGEHFGFGMSFSLDGNYWMDGVDVPLPGGCRTPLGLIEEVGGNYTLLFTRRFLDCSDQQLPPDSRGDACNERTMCANVYAATFSVSWVPWV